MTLGLDVEASEEQPDIERYLYPEYYDCYSTDEIDDYTEYQDTDVSVDYKPVKSTEPLDSPPMDSPWPMYCHDTRHTGRSPYSTADNPYDTKWMFDIYGPVFGGPIIDEDGVLYIGVPVSVSHDLAQFVAIDVLGQFPGDGLSPGPLGFGQLHGNLL